MVQRMTTEGRFDYDAVTYAVTSARAYYDSYYPHYTAVSFGYGWGSPYRYRCGALYDTWYDPFFYDPFLCYDPIFYRPYGYGFFGYGFGYGYGYRSYFGGGYAFHNRSRNLFINRVRTGTSFQMPFRDRSGTNTSVGGVGPRFRVPDGALATRRRPDTTPVRERDAMRRDGGDRVAFPARDRGDRSSPTAREPERRAGGGGGGGEARDGGRAAPEARRWGGGAGGGGTFRTPGIVAARLGRPGLTFVVGVLGAALAFLGALCFAELSTRQPRAAGKYVFVREAFGPRAGFVTGWVEALGTNGVAIAAIGVAGGEFLVRLSGWPPALTAPLGAGLVALFTGINLVGVASGRWVQNLVTAAKLVALGGVVVVAFARGTGAGWHGALPGAPAGGGGGVAGAVRGHPGTLAYHGAPRLA